MRDHLDHSSSTTLMAFRKPSAVKHRRTRRTSLALLFLAALLAAFVPGGLALGAGGVPAIVIHAPMADFISGESELFYAWICPTDSAGNPIFGDNGVPDGVDDACVLIDVVWFVDPLIGDLSTTSGNPTTFTAAALPAGTTVSGQLTATPTMSTLPAPSVTINVTGTELNVVPITCASEEGEKDRQEQTIGQDADGNEVIAELTCADGAIAAFGVRLDQDNRTIEVNGIMQLAQTVKEILERISDLEMERVPPQRPYHSQEYKAEEVLPDTGNVIKPKVEMNLFKYPSDI